MHFELALLEKHRILCTVIYFPGLLGPKYAWEFQYNTLWDTCPISISNQINIIQECSTQKVGSQYNNNREIIMTVLYPISRSSSVASGGFLT